MSGIFVPFAFRIFCCWLAGWLVVSSTVIFGGSDGEMEYLDRFGKKVDNDLFHMNLAVPLSFQRDVLSII